MSEAASNSNGADDRFFDVGAQQVGKVYARALLDAAESAGQTETVVEELDSFVADLLDKLSHFEAVLSSAMIKPEQKLRLFDQLLKGRASPLLLSFLKTLARHGRLEVVRPIRRAVHKLYDELRHVVRVEVRAAAPVTEALQQQVATWARGRFGGTPQLNVQIRPELIGGLVVRVGDTVYDGSVATHLEKLRQTMIDRSVHEIQSRRDRFSSPEGN